MDIHTVPVLDRLQQKEQAIQKYSIAGGKLDRVAVAQITCDGGRIAENLSRILDVVSEARKQGADLVVFPELSIPGYCAMDLFYKPAFLKANRDALSQVIEASKGISIIVGFADEVQEYLAPGGKPTIYNAAAFIYDGKLVHVQHKELLPTYGVFSEKRYFQPAQSRAVVELGDHTVGVAICEDLWAEENRRDITAELKEAGADIVVSLNASPWNEQKVAARMAVLSDAARSHGVTLVYANLVGSFDGYDGEVVFDGRSEIFDEQGHVITALGSFKEELRVVDLKTPDRIEVSAADHIADTHDALVLGIRDFFRRKGCHRAYIGLSGGIDSAVVAALAAEALGPENVIGVTMPSHITSSETELDAFVLAENIGMPCHERPIGEIYKAWLAGATAAHGREPSSITRQNKQAQIRQFILMEYTNEDRGSLLLNTGNKTEVALGYFTLYGDSAGALSVIGDLDKLTVYELARFINRKSGREIIPETTIDRAPTAELEVGQTDENSLPAGYGMLAPLVDDIIERGLSRNELSARYPEEVVERVLKLINGVSEGKRRQLPPAIRVTSTSFGIERRIPMDHTFRDN